MSILLVLAAHMLPLGPKVLKLNHLAGVLGMVLFFILSGFLITRLLLSLPPISHFLIRRIFRIVPLAFVFLICLWLTGILSGEQAWRHFTFTANLPPPSLSSHSGHFWSLCLEVQFYFFIALLVAVLRRHAFFVLPFLAVAITLHRVHEGAHVNITTLLRADEILAGCTLAILHARHEAGRSVRAFHIHPLWVLPFLMLACHPAGGWLNYLRPYLALWVIGASLVHGMGQLEAWFVSRPMIYLAKVSYPLYVVHGGLMETWLGTGDTMVAKYLKRPLLLAVTFALAHLSTFHFENRFIDWGKKLTSRN